MEAKSIISQELAEKGGLPGGAAVHRQLRQDLQQGLLQGEELPPGVQGHLGPAAGDGQHPVREAAEAEDLGKAAGGVPAGGAQVHLRLVGGVLRHQENLVPAAGVGSDAVQHRLGFAGVRPAGQQGQHGGGPPFFGVWGGSGLWESL